MTPMTDIIDLRSDTVTQPTKSMRQAMAAAEVGDDVYGEDPTVLLLEQRAAEILGKDVGLFVPTGTMGNQIAVHLHTRPGTEVVAEAGCHIFNYEMGAMAALSGALPRAVATVEGFMTAEQIAAAINPDTGYTTPTSLVALENSHNLAGGRVMTPEHTAELASGARHPQRPVHLDGARIFNAAAAPGCTAAELAAPVDTVMFCLSKGLAAPVGSMLVGPADVMADARRIRKMFGGGMRQVGVLAAAGLVALNEMVPRLSEDNRRARHLADNLAAIPGIDLDPATVETNIVFFRMAAGARVDAESLAAELRQAGILVHALGPGAIRMVTHYHIADDDLQRTVEITAGLLH
jgi:threonine aldolase